MGLFTMRQVEECLALDINALMRLGIVREGVHDASALEWRNMRTGTVASSCRYHVDCRRVGASSIRFSYRLRDGEQIALTVALTTTRPNYGGLRWWFLCPIRDRSGRVCGRRAGKLYMPAGEAHFGCRVCHELTYQSHQEHRCGLGLLGPLAERTGRRVVDLRGMMKPKIVLQRVGGAR